MKVKVSISSSEFISIDKLLNKTELRNNNVRCFWEGLKHSNLPYKERRRIVMETWYISGELVDRIITRNC